jgi:hypothetical protein
LKLLLTTLPERMNYCVQRRTSSEKKVTLQQKKTSKQRSLLHK